jgi:hypothetical protein
VTLSEDGRPAGCTGTIIARMDSAFCNAAVIGAIRRGGARFSVTAPMNADIRAAIAAIPGDAWTPSGTRAIWDDQPGGPPKLSGPQLRCLYTLMWVRTRGSSSLSSRSRCTSASTASSASAARYQPQQASSTTLGRRRALAISAASHVGLLAIRDVPQPAPPQPDQRSRHQRHRG